MRAIITIILAIFCGVSYAQDFSYPSIKTKGGSIADFLPVGWSVLDSAWGDLNKDGAGDAAIIIQHKDSVLIVNAPEDTVLTQPRVLLILFKNPVDNSLELIERSNSFILRHDNDVMDDPYQEMAINNGVLEISFMLFYSMGNAYTTNASYKFRYRQGGFVFIGANQSMVNRISLDYEEHSYNFLTKKRSLTKGNDQDGSKKVSWKSLKISGLKTLKEFEEPFSWEVEEDVYL